MHKNPIWLGLLAVVMAGTIWFVAKAAWEVYRFYSLSESAKPQLITLSIKQKSRNSYYPVARYSYSVNGKDYQGVEYLKTIAYFRKEFLENDLPIIQKEKKWTIWYSPNNPNWSSLKRNFPYKNILYASLMVGLFCYFLWLGIHVRKL